MAKTSKVEDFVTGSVVGAMLALTSAAESAVTLGSRDSVLFRHNCKPVIKRMATDAATVCSLHESLWSIESIDGINALASDVFWVARVMASLSTEARTNMANDARRSWGHMLEQLGDETGPEVMEAMVVAICAGRGLPLSPPNNGLAAEPVPEQ